MVTCLLCIASQGTDHEPVDTLEPDDARQDIYLCKVDDQGLSSRVKTFG